MYLKAAIIFSAQAALLLVMVLEIMPEGRLVGVALGITSLSLIGMGALFFLRDWPELYASSIIASIGLCMVGLIQLLTSIRVLKTGAIDNKP